MSVDAEREPVVDVKRILKKILRISGLVVGVSLLLVVAAVLLFLFDKPLVKNISQNYFIKKTGMAIQIGKLDYTLFPLRIVLSSVQVSKETPIYNVSVLVNRFEARGELKKLLNRTKPVFETAEVDIAELRLNLKKKSEEPIDFGNAILQTADILGYVQRMAIKSGRFVCSLPSQTIQLEKVSLGLSQSAAESAFDLLLDCENAGASQNDGRFSFDSRLHASGTLTLARTTGVILRLELGSPRFAAAGIKESFKNLIIEAEGTWRTDESKLNFSRLTGSIPDLVDMTGAAAVDYKKDFSLEVNAKARIENLQSLVTRLGPYLPVTFQDFRIQGKARLEGRYSLAQDPPEKSGNLEASLELDRVKLEFARIGFPCQAELSADLKIAGHPPDLQFSGDIRSSIGKIAAYNLGVRNTAVQLKFKASRDFAEISAHDGVLKELAIAFPGDKKLSFEEVKLNGSARLDLKRKSLALTGLEIRLPNFPPFRLSGRFGLEPQGAVQARLEGKDLSIPALRGLLSPFIPTGLAGWEFDGAMDVAVEAKYDALQKRDWSFSGELASSEVKFSDPSFSIAGQGLKPLARIEGSHNFSKSSSSWTCSFELSQGESLWKDFYISWDKHPIKIDITGRYSSVARSVDDLTAQIVFPTLGEVQTSGSVGLRSPLSFKLQMAARLDLNPLYSLYSQARALAEGGLRVNGQLKSDLEILKDQEALSIKGRLLLEDVAVENPATKFFIRGIKADLPVYFASTGGANSADNQARAFAADGSLYIQEIRTPLLTFQPLEIILRSRLNAFQIDPFSLDFFGSRLQFGETVLALNPWAFSFNGSTSLNLADLDLSRLPVASAQFPLTGKARADFSRLDITPGRITSTGRAEVDVFGGKVIVRDFAVTNPFSRSRAVSCNIDLLDLDLKKLTNVVPFGEVTGVIRGEIRDLVLSYGQPERFNLKLESVRKKKVPQTFSLKAVDSLTVISSGEKASLGTSHFWMRFIRGFKYEKIGILSTLKNDTFTLNGTIKENGVEYLVKKPCLFGINVINRMPEKKISFKEMLSRLSRVGQSEKPKVTS
jgi:hypothetical protein